MDDVRLGETDAIGEGEVLLDMTAARSTLHGIEPLGARRRRQEQEPRLSSDSLVRLDATSYVGSPQAFCALMEGIADKLRRRVA